MSLHRELIPSGESDCVFLPLQQPRAGDSSRFGCQVLVLSVWGHCALGAAAGPRKNSVLLSGQGAALSLNAMLVHSQQLLGGREWEGGTLGTTTH